MDTQPVSDRIAVIFKGKIVDVVDATSVDRQQLGLMMLGGRDAQQEQGGVSVGSQND